MGKIPKSLPPQAQAWTEECQRYHLWRAQVQMARELGLNPRKLGKIANHRQEPWKAPLPQFIEDFYLKRFGRERSQVVTSAERWARPTAARKATRNAAAADGCGEQRTCGLP
jgi:hypothetical protein